MREVRRGQTDFAAANGDVTVIDTDAMRFSVAPCITTRPGQ